MTPSMIVTVALKRAITMAKPPITIRAIDCGGSLHTVGTRNERVIDLRLITGTLFQKINELICVLNLFKFAIMALYIPFSMTTTWNMD